jgi:hypothetical protein
VGSCADRRGRQPEADAAVKNQGRRLARFASLFIRIC